MKADSFTKIKHWSPTLASIISDNEKSLIVTKLWPTNRNAWMILIWMSPFESGKSQNWFGLKVVRFGLKTRHFNGSRSTSGESMYKCNHLNYGQFQDGQIFCQTGDTHFFALAFAPYKSLESKRELYAGMAVTGETTLVTFWKMAIGQMDILPSW